MEPRDDVLNTRLPTKLKAGLKRAAEDDRRTMSSMLAIILGEWLEAKGYVKPTPKKKRS